MESILVTDFPATEIMQAGESATLIQNSDLNNNVYLGDTNAANPADISNVVPLSPQSYIVLDGSRDVWGVCDSGKTALIYKMPGGVAFFQSGITGESIIINRNGFFIYSSTPAFGDLILSAVPTGVTEDQFNNPVTPVLQLQGSAGLMTITDPATIQFLSGSTVTGSIKSESVSSTLQVNGPQGISLTGGNVYLGAGKFIYPGQDPGGTGPLAWHSITAPNFQNGWSGIFKWKPGIENEIKFQCGLTPGTDTDGTIICNLFGITAPVSQTHAVWANALRTGAVGTATEGPALQLDTNGNVRCLGIAAACTSVAGVGFWPLDN